MIVIMLGVLYVVRAEFFLGTLRYPTSQYSQVTQPLRLLGRYESDDCPAPGERHSDTNHHYWKRQHCVDDVVVRRKNDIREHGKWHEHGKRSDKDVLRS